MISRSILLLHPSVPSCGRLTYFRAQPLVDANPGLSQIKKGWLLAVPGTAKHGHIV